MADLIDTSTPSLSDTVDVGSVSSSPPAGVAGGTAVGLFKKRGGAKRKEFRAPAAALGGGTQTTSTIEAEGKYTPPVPTGPVDALTASQSATATPSTATPPTVTVADRDSDDDSDSDDDGPHPSLSASALAAQAADVDTSDPDGSDEDSPVDGIHRPTKRAKKENPLLQSTRNKLKKDHKLTIESNRSLEADTSSHGHQVTKLLEASTIVRDPKKPKWSGPQKPAASNVRAISRMDYQPDVCKDYKETGRCGYGDSCVFLHDRGDYQQSWQLDRDWNEAQEKKRKRILLGLPPEEEEDKKEKDGEGDLPWACLICRQPFVTPVVTKCNHYYCEKCAIEHYVKDTKCFACKAQTHGIFNTATKLIAVLKQRSSSGVDPRAAIEKLEAQRQAEKEAIAQSQKWQMPGRTEGL